MFLSPKVDWSLLWTKEWCKLSDSLLRQITAFLFLFWFEHILNPDTNYYVLVLCLNVKTYFTGFPSLFFMSLSLKCCVMQRRSHSPYTSSRPKKSFHLSQISGLLGFWKKNRKSLAFPCSFIRIQAELNWVNSKGHNYWFRSSFQILLS